MIPSAYWPWIKVAVFGLACVWCYGFGSTNAKARCEREWLELQNADLKDRIAILGAAIDQAKEAQAKADKLARLPAKVVTVVRANPSGCSIARPVTDSVREQVRQTNDAIRTAPVP